MQCLVQDHFIDCWARFSAQKQTPYGQSNSTAGRALILHMVDPG